jgi:hypothetical protein
VGLQAARQVKAHERHVLEVLHVDIAHIGQEGVQGFGVQRQFQQARMLGVSADLVGGRLNQLLGVVAFMVGGYFNQEWCD